MMRYVCRAVETRVLERVWICAAQAPPDQPARAGRGTLHADLWNGGSGRARLVHDKNTDLLVAYFGSSVELARALGCSEHLITMFYCVVSSVLREGRKLKSLKHPLYCS